VVVFDAICVELRDARLALDAEARLALEIDARLALDAEARLADDAEARLAEALLTGSVPSKMQLLPSGPPSCLFRAGFAGQTGWPAPVQGIAPLYMTGRPFGPPLG
tara:strand:- start:712 stop:1029 length:318 start_codon:yes stop_codon:yes gene_type:complete